MAQLNFVHTKISDHVNLDVWEVLLTQAITPNYPDAQLLAIMTDMK